MEKKNANRNEELRERREHRRQRRRRNQIMAYLTLIVILALIVGGSLMALKYLTAPKDSKTDDMEAHIDSLVSSEEEIQKPDPSSFVPELTEEEKLDAIVNGAIEVMPLEDKVAGLFIVTPESITGVSTATQAGDGTKIALGQYAVGGVVYFAKNITSAQQISEMINNTVLYSRYPIFVGVDEEGGSVNRVAKAGIGTDVGNAADIGATGDAGNAYQAGKTIAEYLLPLGFNLDFAPVADINNVEKSVIGSRSFGSDAATVAAMVSSMVQGLEESGVSSCLKHFPGIGSSVDDTHNGLASTDRSAEDFRANEFTVFKAGIDAGVDFIMVSHMAATGLTGDKTPATFSPEIVTSILRNELNFKGVIITDALNMSAISEYYGADEAAIMAVKAGCDMLLMPEDFEKAYNGVLDAVKNGTIAEERIDDSLRRIYRIKYADKIAD